MPGPRRPPASSRRLLAVYLAAIVGPTLILLILGLQSVQRQYQAIADLTFANARLSGETLVIDVEQRVSQLAEACLRDEALGRLTLDEEELDTPAGAERVTRAFDEVKRRHPIAEDLFVLQANAVRYPRLLTPRPRTLDELLQREPPAARQAFLKVFSQAEDLELADGRLADARAFYERASRLPVSPRARALALGRLARCDERAGAIDRTLADYRELVDRYGDQYDLADRPQALVAATELMRLRGSRAPEVADLVAATRRDLLQSRWQVTAEQADYFLEKLQVPPAGHEEPPAALFRGFELARALQDGFQHHGPLRAGAVYNTALQHGARTFQLFYTARSVSDPTLLGVSIDLARVEAEIIPARAAALQIDGVRITTSGGAEAAGSSPTVPFPRLFPLWRLARTPEATPGRQSWRPLAVFAGSTLLVLALLLLGVVLVVRDVGREHELNQLQADFVSGVSHELKTPLTLIRLYADTLADDPGAAEDDRRGYYDIISRETERLTTLIDRVLDFSRIERGAKQYQFQIGPLTPAVARTVEIYGQYLHRKGFSVEADLAPDLRPVRFDADAVAQALVNLMDNAAKYSGDSRYVAVRVRPEPSAVVVEVEDRGIGITPDDRAHVFERFYRAADRSGRGGYGLGLFLVKHVMDAHGGSVQLESERGKGSRFRLLFPVSTAGSPDEAHA